MANNKTDYTKPRTDLLELLPEPLQSDVNLSLFDNVFNRYLTKQEIEKVAGYIGRGNPNAVRSRQIHEEDVHRQAYQLQPIPYAKIGSVEHMTSWVDMQKELERLGVDIDDFDKWGATQKFNWVPPVDINKIINYRDYYWVDDGTSPTPQYITIRSTCSTATSRFNFWEGLISQFGSTFAIDDVENGDTATSYNITEFATGPDVIKVSGDATADILLGDWFEVTNSTSNDGTYRVTSDPTYSGVTQETTIEVDGTIVAEAPTVDSSVAIKFYNKLVLPANTHLEGSPPVAVTDSGDYTSLFVEGFVFFVRNTTNTDLNDSFVEAISSTYDATTKETTVIIKNRVTDNTAGGEISLEEQLSVYEADMKCQCGDFGGWDMTLWDDNPREPLWGDVESAYGSPSPDGISDHENLINRISHTGPPMGSPVTHGELWYDTVANILYQYNTTSGWVVIWRNFSLILDQTNGGSLWDLALACDLRPRIEDTNQWISQNKWFHKNDVVNFTSVQRANQPIIEYDWDLELNEWTYVNYNWAYRSEKDLSFATTTEKPPRIELEPLVWWQHAGITGTTIIFDDRYGDMTDYFVEGRQVFFTDDLLKTVYTVSSSTYELTSPEYPYRTTVTFTQRPPEFGSPTVVDNLETAQPNKFPIIPVNTLQGHPWDDYGVHWLFNSVDDSLPSPHQPLNPYMEIADTLIPIPYMDAGSPSVLKYEYNTSLYTQNYLLAQNRSTFMLNDEIHSVGSPAVPISTRRLTRTSLYGFNDIRVYAADAVGDNIQREFGTYDEIGEAVFDIVGIDFINNEFIIDASITNFDPSPYFASGSPGDTIRVADNVGIAPTLFTVDSTSTNRIRVVEPIPAKTTVNGNISNITSPVPPDDFANTKHVTIYVIGINFFTDRPAGTNVRIILGEASINEIGTAITRVRTIVDNDQYDIHGNTTISTTAHRIVEQLKTSTNQYPLFDIFTVEGEPAYKVSPIFGYRTSPDADINQAVGLRIVHDAVDDIYEFDQFLLEEDNGELFAYRDYANKVNNFWYNKETNELKFWDGVLWNDKTEMSEFYRRAVVSSVEPSVEERQIDGLYWYNTATDTLLRRFVPTNSWIVVDGVDQLVTDANLQTIWRAGTNNDMYIPAQRDWMRRTEQEYNDERSDYISSRAEEIVANDPSISDPAAILQATNEWYESQANHLSETGQWIGDWEIPDPLYFNNLHENRKYLDSRELLAHFTTIINEQPDIPGWTGTKAGQFNLVHINQANYGLGGTIKEYNNGFDTLISSIMVNNVTPRSLIEFAHDQYEGLLNTIKEIYRENAVGILSDVSIENILNVSPAMADEIITLYEANDNTAYLYGDSTTFTDNEGVNDLGVRNWIATLPYLKLVFRVAPQRLIDEVRGLNEVVHHDGHRHTYGITDATSDIISKFLINTPDPRFPSESLGVQSSSSPANNITEFNAEFTAISSREGVYWYHTSAANILYRYVVAASGTVQPSDSYADGTLWMDLTPTLEVLRVKTTSLTGVVSWDIVDGLVVGDGRLHNGSNPSDLTTATISAWEVIDLDVILGDIIFELENRLYENAPEPATLNYDVEDTNNENEIKFLEYLNESFLSHVSQSEIEDPYRNVFFDSADPFTWNYKRSAPGGSINIIDVNETTDCFTVAGDKTLSFTAGITFYVKNSTYNDGTWETITSVYDGGANTTAVFVTGSVTQDEKGAIYTGSLPSPISTSNPNNLNDGSESGGCWCDLYEKFYGTPYPHLEPWTLQGYTSKPSWWDEEYLNNTAEKWGERTWKYKHGFDITAVDLTYDAFGINSEFVEAFPSQSLHTVDKSTANNNNYVVRNLDTITSVNPGAAGIASFVVDDTSGFASATYSVGQKIAITDGATFEIKNTYVIRNTNLVGTDFTIVVEEEIESGDIIPAIDVINGSVYTPSTNKTMVYVTAPIPDATVDGRLATPYGMWENIRIGVIPAGREYPNGIISITGNPATDAAPPYGLSTEILPTFNYFSVNIDNITVSADGGTTNFAPDAVLSPYWNNQGMYGTVSPTDINSRVRAIYTDFSNEIISPNANYAFNDRGPVEWRWKASSQYLYDQLSVSYRLDPAEFMYHTFGFNFTTIGGLLIDRDVRNTASHTRTNFHGDVVNNEQFTSDGINQWYVNFNRYASYDSNFSDFQPLWTLWTAPLTYQFASYIDTPSLSVGHRYIDLTNFDYEITSKRSPGVDDFWMDAFKIQILNIPYDLGINSNQLDWRFDVRTNISSSREIKYYDVRNYQFRADPATNECTLYTWKVTDVNTFDNVFTIMGDQEFIFRPGRQFVVTDSSGNDGTYTIETATYDTIAKTTDITVTTSITSPSRDGLITLLYRNIPWETGDAVYLSTTGLMPVPLETDTIIGTTKYFIIKTSDNTFKIANTLADANAGIEIPITSSGSGDTFVGELLSTFSVGKAKNINWRQYAIDKTNELSWWTPKQIQGMQTMVDIIRGYDVYTKENGWFVNDDRSLRDPDTGAIVTWQVEIERLIDYAYSTGDRRKTLEDRYQVTPDSSTNEFTFTSTNTNTVYITGDLVSLISSNNVYPEPFSRGINYFMIRDNLDTFKLAASRVDAEAGNYIEIISTTGVGELAIMTPNEVKYLVPPFELNPFRNAIWFKPEFGIVSNVITGPVDDIRTTQLVFDQEGNTIDVDQLRVYRRDKETKIIVQDAINPNPEVTFVDGRYNYLHLGGLHIFTDSYEHVMKFNNYSAGDNLLYDPFIGLNVTKYEMIFNRNPEFTGRPNVGGYYLETFFNQGANIKENFEAGVENLRYSYDTYNILESNLMAMHSRDTIGYEGIKDYLTNLNISEKSQFIFWRGQIQSKGSVNAVKAYINSRRFIDAKIDEFWAIKVAEFGSIEEKEYPEMFATTVDARSNEFKVEFIDNDDDGSNVDNGFTIVRMSDTDRWYNQPVQAEVLRNNGKVMYFDMKIIGALDGTPVGSPAVSPITVDGNGYIVHGMDVDAVEITQAGNPFTAFEYINPYVIRLTGSPLPTVDNLIIYGYVANQDAQNPARLIDRGSDTQLSTIEFWDPARDNHYSNAIHNVDIQNYNDPAIYVNTPQEIDDTRAWTDAYVGTSWMDTSTMDYIPYHSDKVIVDNDTRFRSWGQLYDYAGINIYEWVESDVAPTAWDAAAEQEQGDNTIPEAQRKSGVAKYTLFEPDPSYMGSPPQWIPLKNKVDTQYAATDGPAGSFTINLSIIDNTKAVDVYINEIKQPSVQPVGSPAVLPVTVNLPVKENDIVKFVQAVPTDPTEIAAEIAAGNLRQEYEYTTVTEYDSFGNLSTKYYFWVGSKSTKPAGRNRTMSLAEAEQQLVSVPSAHMFFQKVLEETSMTESGNPVNRVEYFTPTGSPSELHEYTLELPHAPGTVVYADIDGVDVDQDDISFVTSGSPTATTAVTLNVPIGSPVPDLVKITYTGVYDNITIIPVRYSQVIIRGLQGIVFDDSRYTIRFTRDYTLRDNLDVENESIGPLGLNNLHEEWKIFRKEQSGKIDRWMWDKVTESMVGYKLDDTNERVPSFEYQLYDEKYGTQTQYGLKANQAFVNGTLAASSILAYLIDPTVDFAPIDINVFFSDYNFDTPENIIAAMDSIYTTFSVTDVNRMYFSVLNDAFTTKSKYPGIFKTSMVSLHGIRPFQSSGVFDD